MARREPIELVRIQFTKSQPPYHAGEGARRSPKDALHLVALGVAKFIDPPPGLDEFGNALEEKAAPKKATTAKRKANVKPKPKAKPKPKGKPKGKS